MNSIVKRSAAILAVAGALTLTGCAPDPDLTDLADQLATEVPNVVGVETGVGHSNFPSETQIHIDLFFDPEEISPEVIAEAIRDAAPIIVADPAGHHQVTIVAIEGAPEDFADRFDKNMAQSNMMIPAAEILGLENHGTPLQTFQFDELARFAEAQQ